MITPILIIIFVIVFMASIILFSILRKDQQPTKGTSSSNSFIWTDNSSHVKDSIECDSNSAGGDSGGGGGGE